MSNAKEIAERALALATRFLEESRGELLTMADHDHDVLFRASQLVREQSTGGPALQHSIEHLAFSLIAAAHDDLRQEH